MNKIIYFLLVVAMITACNQKPTISNVQPIGYTTPYRFSSQIEADFQKDTTSSNFYNARRDYAMLGDIANTDRLKSLDPAENKKNHSHTFMPGEIFFSKSVNAIDYILEKAKSNRIIIINEAHNQPQHRVFVQQLLAPLSRLGYNHLGLEALNNWDNTDSLLQDKHYPTQKMGYYLKSPQLGNMIRSAQANNYHVFAYEDFEGLTGKEREMIQAKHIAQMMNKYPDDKFIIHCGYAHIQEGTHRVWEKCMAGRLKELTSNDPFTIDQTLYHKKNSELQTVSDTATTSLILFKNDKPLVHIDGERQTDVAVIHPSTKYHYNRPAEYFNTTTHPTPIPLKELTLSYPVILQAYHHNEDYNIATPLDVYEITHQLDTAYLALPKGDFTILATSISGDAIQFDCSTN